MSPILLRTFDDLDCAQAARDALLDQGVQAVELTVLRDEAGPAEGNFIAGNGAVGTGGNTAFVPQPRSDESAYCQNYQPVRYRAGYLLRVSVRNDDERQRAEATLKRFHGIDVDRPSG